MSDLADVIARVRELLAKATPQNIDTAETKEVGSFECPACNGEGFVEGALYMNYDNVAANVHFTGIGAHFGDAERLFRALVEAAPTILDAAEAGMRARDAALEEAANVADQLVFDEVALSGTNDATEGLKLTATRIRALRARAQEIDDDR